MDYQPLYLRCHCGETPSRIEEVGLSAAHELVIHWWCSGCGRVAYTTMALADCWQVCPKPAAEESAVTVPDLHESSGDDGFLRSLGVRFLAAGE